MFGIGTSEILIVLLIALLILGPKEIPKIARTIGRGMRELERAKNEFRQSIEFEAEEDGAQSQISPEKTETSEDENAENAEELSDEELSDNVNDLPSKRV